MTPSGFWIFPLLPIFATPLTLSDFLNLVRLIGVYRCFCLPVITKGTKHHLFKEFLYFLCFYNFLSSIGLSLLWIFKRYILDTYILLVMCFLTCGLSLYFLYDLFLMNLSSLLWCRANLLFFFMVFLSYVVNLFWDHKIYFYCLSTKTFIILPFTHTSSVKLEMTLTQRVE